MPTAKNASGLVVCLTLFLLILVSPFFWECKRINPDGPPATTLDSTLATPLSYISIPIHYELRRFENFLNAKISGRFLVNGLKVRDNRDSVYLELSKRAPIRLKIRGQRLYIDFPIHAEGTYFGNFAGIKIQNKKNPIETDIRLLLEAEVMLDEDWHILPKIEVSKIEWIKDPVVKIGPLKFNLQQTLDKMLKEKKPEFESLLEKQIHDHVSLEKAIGKIWLDLQKPMPIYKKEPKVWFKFGFRQVSGAVRLEGPDQIICNVLVEADAAISPDSLHLPSTDSVLPRLQPYPQIVKESFNLSVHASIPFEYADPFLSKILKGKKIEKNGYSVTIEKVAVYGTDSGIAVKLNTKGDIKGNLYLAGCPRYYNDDSKLRLDSFNYDINTQSLLINAAAEVLREPLLEYLEPYMEIEVGQYLSLVPSLISGAIEKGKAGESIRLHIDTLEVWDQHGIATRSDFQLVLRTRGQAKLELKRLKPGKKLRIRKKTQRHPSQ